MLELKSTGIITTIALLVRVPIETVVITGEAVPVIPVNVPSFNGFR